LAYAACFRRNATLRVSSNRTRGIKQADGSFSADPSGQYLRGPFAYCTCVDRDGDGLIRTSTGLGDILPWGNDFGVDDAGGVSTAEDECILNYTRIVAVGARTIAIDANNDGRASGVTSFDSKLCLRFHSVRVEVGAGYGVGRGAAAERADVAGVGGVGGRD
jgi:hypothetical protein